MHLMARYLRPFFKRMGVGLSIKITATMLELALPYILNYILKNVVAEQKISSVIYWGLLMMVCAFAACVGNIIANRMAAKVARNFSENVRRDLFDRSIRLSAAQTDRFTIASLESRITTDTYNVHNFVGMMQRMGVRAPILLVGGTAITLFMDRRLSLVMLAILPFIFVTVYIISRRGVPLYTRVQQSVDGMVRVVREDVGGIRVIKALSKDGYEHSRYDKVNKALIKDETTAGVTMGAVNPIMTVLMNLGIVSVTAMAASSVNGGLPRDERQWVCCAGQARSDPAGHFHGGLPRPAGAARPPDPAHWADFAQCQWPAVFLPAIRSTHVRGIGQRV